VAANDRKPNHKMKINYRPWLLTAVLSALLALFLNAAMTASAADAKADGTWAWTTPGRNGGQERKMTLKLKTEGEKVTGKLSTPGRDGQARETEIQDGKMKGDEISFTIVREINNNKMTSKYTGKVGAETIKGKIEFTRDGNTQSRDWEAKREASEKK
jgi:hypothetical protein